MKHLMMVGLIMLAALHFVSPQRVSACTATPEGIPSYTLADQVNATDIILEGTVTAVTGEYYDQTAAVSVQQYLKGEGPTEVMIGHFGSSATCLVNVFVGDHLIFFTNGDPATGLNAFYMSAGAAVQAATEENIAAINAVLSQDPVSGPEQTASRLPDSVRRVLGGLAVVLWMMAQ